MNMFNFLKFFVLSLFISANLSSNNSTQTISTPTINDPQPNQKQIDAMDMQKVIKQFNELNEQITKLKELMNTNKNTPEQKTKIQTLKNKIETIIKTIDKTCDVMVKVYDRVTSKKFLIPLIVLTTPALGFYCKYFNPNLVKNLMRKVITKLLEIKNSGTLIVDEVLIEAQAAAALKVLKDQPKETAIVGFYNTINWISKSLVSSLSKLGGDKAIKIVIQKLFGVQL